MSFAEHGEFSFRTEGAILFVESVGSFNKELIEHFVHERKEAIRSFNGQKSIEIIETYGLDLIMPDALNIISNSDKEVMALGLFLSIIVLRSEESRNSIVFQQLENISDNSGIKNLIVNTMEEAIEIANEYLMR